MTGLTAAEAALARAAREASADEFMRGQVEAFHRRRGGRRAAVIARGEPVTCRECAALDATEEESFAIHHPELLPDDDGGQGEPFRSSSAPRGEIFRVTGAAFSVYPAAY